MTAHSAITSTLWFHRTVQRSVDN